LNWARCDKCDRWRVLPEWFTEDDVKDLPKRWYCSMNEDQKYNRCEVPEQLDEKVIRESRRRGRKKSMSAPEVSRGRRPPGEPLRSSGERDDEEAVGGEAAPRVTDDVDEQEEQVEINDEHDDISFGGGGDDALVDEAVRFDLEEQGVSSGEEYQEEEEKETANRRNKAGTKRNKAGAKVLSERDVNCEGTGTKNEPKKTRIHGKKYTVPFKHNGVPSRSLFTGPDPDRYGVRCYHEGCEWSTTVNKVWMDDIQRDYPIGEWGDFYFFCHDVRWTEEKERGGFGASKWGKRKVVAGVKGRRYEHVIDYRQLCNRFGKHLQGHTYEEGSKPPILVRFEKKCKKAND